MPVAIELNGVDLSTYGFTAQRPPQLLSSPRLSYDPIVMPGRAGARPGLRTIGSKPFTIEGLLESTSLAAAKTNLDALNSLLTRAQPSTVIAGWSTDRRLIVEGLGVEVEPLGSAFGVFKYNVALQFEAPDSPFWQATTQSIINVGSAIPAGNAPFFPQFRVQGVITNPTLTILSSTGDTLASIGFTIAVSSSQYLCIDNEKMTAYLNETGNFSSGTNVIGDLTSGDFFAILPEYYDFPASGWATAGLLASTAVSSTQAIQMLYYKQWY